MKLIVAGGVAMCMALSAYAADEKAAAVVGKEPALAEKAPAAATEARTLKWLTSLDEAKKAAAEKKTPILVDFSGSDWCGWCVRLDKEVFSKPAFAAYAETSLVLLLVDFPRQKQQDDATRKQNKDLMTTFGVRGFPTVVLLDAEGKELARTGYQAGGDAAYVEHLKKLLQK